MDELERFPLECEVRAVITAEWLPTVYGYKLTTDQVGPRWYRGDVWPDGRTQNTDLGTGNPVTDLMVPLDGATVTYTAVTTVGEEDIQVTPPEAVKPVLGLPNRPDIPAAQVTVQTAREFEVQGRSYVYEVLDRNVPLVEPEPPIDRQGEMVLRMEHPVGATYPGKVLRDVRAMLRTGEPFHLRSTCHERVDSVSAVAVSFTETAFGDNNEHGPSRLITIQWRAVEPLWGDNLVIAARIWATVPIEFATWADVPAQVATWDELAYGGVG